MPITNPPSPIRKWLAAGGVALGVALLIVAPFFWLGNASGHDFEFHAASWLDVAGQWKEGIVIPKWTEWANHGFGEPRFIFYPPLSWLLGAALSFVVPWNHVPVAFIVFVQTFAGLSAFALARRMLPDRAALFGAACFAANPNALLIVYMRSDFAELLASAFFPLVILTALQLMGVLERRTSFGRTTILFAICFACVWLSNAPAGVMASYGIALLIVWAAVSEKSLRPAISGAAGLALGFGLAAFYIVPAAYEQRWVNITQALSQGLTPADNFLYTYTADPEHTLFNWIASTTAVLMIVIAGAGAVVAHRTFGQSDEETERRKIWIALLLLAAVATILMLRPTLVLWNLLPKLRFVQFPWRWMSTLAVPFACFAAFTAARRRFGWIWILAIAAMLICSGAALVHQAWWDDEDIPTLRTALARGEGFDGVDEYDPAGDDHYNLPPRAEATKVLSADGDSATKPDAKILIARWTAEEKILFVRSSAPVRVALRLLNYPAWRVDVNGAQVTPERADDFDQMIVPVPKGETRITVRFTRTRDRTWGGTISLASLLIVVMVLGVAAMNQRRFVKEPA